MKQDDFMESIFGCMERIEDMIKGLSNAQTVNNNTEVDNSANEAALQEVRQDLNSVKTVFNRVNEGLAAVKFDTAKILERNSMSGKFLETLSALKSEQRQNYERQSELLERFTNAETEAMKNMTEKMESFSTSVRNKMNNPITVNYKHNISIDNPYIFGGIIVMFAIIVVQAVALYFAKQPDYDRIDNDLKYRYIKMKGEATPKQISKLEDLFELNRDNAKIKQMREDVEAYEDAVRKQAALAEQARLKEQAAKELDNKAKSIKGKPIQTDKQKK